MVRSWLLAEVPLLATTSSVNNHPANTGLDNPAEASNLSGHENNHPILSADELIQNDERIVRRPSEQDEDEGEKESSDGPNAKRLGNDHNAEKAQKSRNVASPRTAICPSLAISPQDLNLSM
jgi:hypothetical protein